MRIGGLALSRRATCGKHLPRFIGYDLGTTAQSRLNGVAIHPRPAGCVTPFRGEGCAVAEPVFFIDQAQAAVLELNPS